MSQFGTFHRNHTASAAAASCAAAAPACADGASKLDLLVDTAVCAVSIFVLVIHLCRELRMSGLGVLGSILVWLLLAAVTYVCSLPTHRVN